MFVLLRMSIGFYHAPIADIRRRAPDVLYDVGKGQISIAHTPDVWVKSLSILTHRR